MRIGVIEEQEPEGTRQESVLLVVSIHQIDEEKEEEERREGERETFDTLREFAQDQLQRLLRRRVNYQISANSLGERTLRRLTRENPPLTESAHLLNPSGGTRRYLYVKSSRHLSAFEKVMMEVPVVIVPTTRIWLQFRSFSWNSGYEKPTLYKSWRPIYRAEIVVNLYSREGGSSNRTKVNGITNVNNWLIESRQ